MKAGALKELRRADDRGLLRRHDAEARGWVPPYALGDAELWSHKVVKIELVDAFRLLRQIGGRVGHERLKAAWPDHVRDYAAEKTRTSPYRSTMTVTRMEMVLLGWKDADGAQHPAWLAGQLLAVPEYREKLEAWVFAELRGESSIDLCRRRGWSLRTMQWQRDRAAGMIAERLNRAEVEVW